MQNKNILCDLTKPVPKKWTVRSVTNSTGKIQDLDARDKMIVESIGTYFDKIGVYPPYNGFARNGTPLFFHNNGEELGYTTSSKLEVENIEVSHEYFYNNIYLKTFRGKKQLPIIEPPKQIKTPPLVKPIFALVINSVSGTRLFTPCLTGEGPGVMIGSGKFILKSELQRIYDSIEDLKLLDSIKISGIDFAIEPGILKKIIEGI